MIIGDPNTFSIVFEVVKDWNIPNTEFNNGVLLLSILPVYSPDQLL